MRLLSRLDGMDLLHFEESPEGEARPPLFAARDEASGARFTGSAALREIAQALPGGKYALPLLRVVLGPLFAFASARREGVARFFGLTLPGRQRPPAEPSPLALVRAPLSAPSAGRRCSSTWPSAPSGRPSTRTSRSPRPSATACRCPHVMQATIGYPRLYQGWGMFAPNPITEDGTVVVDARTIDGRHVDPFTGKEPELDLTRAEGLGLGQIQQDYFNRIRLDHNTGFRQGLSEYLKRVAPAHGPARGRAGGLRRLLGPRPVPQARHGPPVRQRDARARHLAQARLPAAAGPAAAPARAQGGRAPRPLQPDKAEPRRIFGIKLPAFMQ